MNVTSLSKVLFLACCWSVVALPRAEACGGFICDLATNAARTAADIVTLEETARRRDREFEEQRRELARRDAERARALKEAEKNALNRSIAQDNRDIATAVVIEGQISELSGQAETIIMTVQTEANLRARGAAPLRLSESEMARLDADLEIISAAMSPPVNAPSPPRDDASARAAVATLTAAARGRNQTVQEYVTAALRVAQDGDARVASINSGARAMSLGMAGLLQAQRTQVTTLRGRLKGHEDQLAALN